MASNGFMRIEGIAGESTHAKYKKWCEINKIEIEITNDRYKGEEDEEESKKPKKKERITAIIGDVTIGKLMDLASTDIMEACWRNSVVGKVEIACLRADGSNRGLEYLKMVMHDVTIISCTAEYSEGELIGEDVVMASKKIRFTYKSAARKIKGMPVENESFLFDQIKRTTQ